MIKTEITPPPLRPLSPLPIPSTSIIDKVGATVGLAQKQPATPSKGIAHLKGVIASIESANKATGNRQRARY